jgi:DNA-binding transcriptional ArsR family regulator
MEVQTAVDTEELALLMKALSSKTRLRMLMLLRRHPLCAGGIARGIGASASTASQHLRVLRSAGLVADCRRGSHVHYSLVAERLRELEDAVGRLIPEGEPCDACRKPSAECGEINPDED